MLIALTRKGLWDGQESQLLTLINSSALPLFVATQSENLRYAISFVAVMLNFVWYFVNWRSRKRVKYWQDCLFKMEPSETELGRFRVFTGPDAKTITRPPWFYAINLLPFTFSIVWVTAFCNTRVPGLVDSFFNFLKERGIL